MMNEVIFWSALIILIGIACILAFILGLITGLGTDDGGKSLDSHERYLKSIGKEKKYGFRHKKSRKKSRKNRN